MLRPSFQRKMPPNAEAERGASFQPSVKSMPLIRWTIRSPPTPVPYSFQQRQRAKRYLSKGILGASFSQVSQSRLAGERSSGGGYSQAPVGSLRPKVSSTISTTPMAPDLYSSLALPHSTERSEEHTSELQSLRHLVCRLLLEKIKPPPHRR